MSPGRRPRRGTRPARARTRPSAAVTRPTRTRMRPIAASSIGVIVSLQGHQKDPIVVRRGRAAAVAIRGEYEQLAGADLEDVAKPPVLIGEELLLIGDGLPVRGEDDPVKMLPAERAEDEGAPKRSGASQEGRARGRPRLHAPALDERIAEAAVAGDAANGRPAVVCARDDEVDLVMAAVREEVRGSVLGRVERPAVGVPRDALHVAVPQRPDRRAGERIFRGDAAVLVYPERLPGRRRGALRVRAVLGIAGRDVE